ncbi:MAG: hypothetical protein IPN86_19605 [Saprospiraceae bacterium]|nr:hypothetical protein [Saprospiraceae bacterium]
MVRSIQITQVWVYQQIVNLAIRLILTSESCDFVDHNSYYALNGAHADRPMTVLIVTMEITIIRLIHVMDVIMLTTAMRKNQNHTLNNFAQDCTTCHSENVWQPSTFNHDGLYFPNLQWQTQWPMV